MTVTLEVTVTYYPMDKLILVTGATGYIASRLIPRLLESGYRVRALARDPRRLQVRAWFNKIDIVQADVTTSSTLASALADVDTAYYFIHNMSYGHGYTSIELEAAKNFTRAAEKAGIQHIIYLGGLADPDRQIAPHMRSRIETGNLLREGQVPVTEFRAGVIAGSGSISFEMLRFMTELFPIIPGPLWMTNKSQPIAIQNIIDYLVAALENKNGQGQVFEIGGPDIITYKNLMLQYAYVRGLHRRMLLFPGIPLWFMAFGVGLMTPVPYPIAYALIGALSADSVVNHPKALKVFPEVKLINFDSATKDALEKTHPLHIERVWEMGRVFGSLRNRNRDNTLQTAEIWSALKHEGCFIDHRARTVSSSPEQIFQAVAHFVSKYNWQIECSEENSRIIACNGHQRFGRQWLEWHVDQTGREGSQRVSPAHLTQTVFFSPHGLPGFLYWILLYPFHWMRFRGLIREITAKSENQ